MMSSRGSLPLAVFAAALMGLFFQLPVSRAEPFEAHLEIDATGVYVCTRAPAGRLLQLESAIDLTSWLADGGAVYSLGQEVRAWIMPTPQGSGGDGSGNTGGGTPPDVVEREQVTLFLRAFTGSSPARTLVSGASDVSGTGILVEGKDFTGAPPFFLWLTEGYQFTVATGTAPWEPHYADAITGRLDTALAAFLADYSGVLDSVITPYQQSGQVNSPPSTTAGSNPGGSRVFYRWTSAAIDSNSDGLTDEEALARGLDPFAPNGDSDRDGLADSIEVLASAELYGLNALSGDSNGNGVPDGSEEDGDGVDPGTELRDYGTSPFLMDTDGDGAHDQHDAVGYEPTLTWQREPVPRYAVVEIFPPNGTTANGGVILSEGSYFLRGLAVMDLRDLSVVETGLDTFLNDAINSSGQVVVRDFKFTGGREHHLASWKPGEGLVHLPVSESYRGFTTPGVVRPFTERHESYGYAVGDDGWVYGTQSTSWERYVGSAFGSLLELLAWPPGGGEPVVLHQRFHLSGARVPAQYIHNPALVDGGRALVYSVRDPDFQNVDEVRHFMRRKVMGGFGAEEPFGPVPVADYHVRTSFNGTVEESPTEPGGGYTTGVLGAWSIDPGTGGAVMVADALGQSSVKVPLLLDPGTRESWTRESGGRVPGSLEVPVLNNRGQFIAEDERQGKLWQNGRQHDLAELAGPTYAQVSPKSINNAGLIGARARKEGENEFAYSVLVPVELVTRSPEGGLIEEAGSIVAASNPTPEVEMELVEAKVVLGNTIEIRVQGRVTDRLSEVMENPVDRVQSLVFSINRDEVQRTDGLPALSVGQVQLPFKPYHLDYTFDETFRIQNAGTGSYTLRVETSPNAAGQTGFDRVIVSAQRQALSNQVPLPAPPGSEVLLEDQLVIEHESELAGSQQRSFEPLIFRLNGIDEWWEPGSGFKVTVNGQDQQTRPFTYSPEYRYIIAEGDDRRPKIFVISGEDLPDNVSADNLTIGEEEGEVTYGIKIRGQEVDAITVQVLADKIEEDVAVAKPSGAVTMDQVLFFYEIIYGEQGLKLYEWFTDDGNVIELTDVLRDLDIDYIFRRDSTAKIQVEEDTNPVRAATLLWAGLNQALRHYSETIPITELQFHIAARAGIAQEGAHIAAAATELYLSGITMINEGADWVWVINDVSQGHYASAAAALPFVAVWMVREGRRVLVKNQAGKLIAEFGDDKLLDAITAAARKRSFDDRWAALKAAGITPAQASILVKGGVIPFSKSRKQLDRRMRKSGRMKPGPNYDAHHDLPWDNVAWFAWHGIDVNDPKYGRWVHMSDHSRWHGVQGNPIGRKWNDEWNGFIARESSEVSGFYSKAEIETFMRKMRSLYTAENPIK